MGLLVSWKSTKQPAVARSNSEAQYCTMADGTSELLWIKNPPKELELAKDMLIILHYDMTTLHIASGPGYYERMEHIKVGRYFIHKKSSEERN